MTVSVGFEQFDQLCALQTFSMHYSCEKLRPASEKTPENSPASHLRVQN